MTNLYATAAALQLQAPWQWQRNEGSRWAALAYGALALLLSAPIVAAMVWFPPWVVWVTGALLLSPTVLFAWSLQFSALLRMDHPHVARLVPGHSQALRVTAVGLWFLLVLCCGAASVVAVLSLGKGWWLVNVVLLAAGAALLYGAMAVRWPWLWLVIWLYPLPAVLPGMQSLANSLLAAALPIWQTQRWGVTTLALAFMALLLPSLFGKADTLHANAYARRERARALAAAGAGGQKSGPTSGHWGNWFDAAMRRLDKAWLAHLTQRARSHRGSVMARVELVLHGKHHWMRQVSVVLFVQALVLLFFGVAAFWGSPNLDEILADAHVGMSIGLGSMLVGPLLHLRAALWHTRREQALLMLLPGVPQGQALNHALARQQLLHFARVWAATLPSFIALALLAHAPQVLAMPGSALLMAACLWRDVSRQRAPQPSAVFWVYLSWLLLSLLSLLLLRTSPGLLWPWLLFTGALAAGLLRWRWRLLATMPQALPAGRLA